MILAKLTIANGLADRSYGGTHFAAGQEFMGTSDWANAKAEFEASVPDFNNGEVHFDSATANGFYNAYEKYQEAADYFQTLGDFNEA